MSKDRLFVDDRDRHCFRIAWYLAEDDDEGATLGEGDNYTTTDLAQAKGEDRPHIVACITAAVTDGVAQDSRGYYWESRRAATTALRRISLAIKNDGGPPWPEWATKAAAEGWKAPKGWKPA